MFCLSLSVKISLTFLMLPVFNLRVLVGEKNSELHNYGNLKQICDLLIHGVLVLALTATVTHNTVESIVLALAMYSISAYLLRRAVVIWEVHKMLNLGKKEVEKWNEIFEGICVGIVSDLGRKWK